MSKSSQNRTRKPNAKGRNKAQVRFVMLEHYLLKSEAFKHLSGDALKVLIILWARHNGVNNGKIGFGVRAGEDFHLSKDVNARALSELEEKGFIRCTRDSSFGTNSRMAREWELTAEAVGERLARKDFMQWVPAAKPQVKRARKPGGPEWQADAVKNKS